LTQRSGAFSAQNWSSINSPRGTLVTWTGYQVDPFLLCLLAFASLTFILTYNFWFNAVNFNLEVKLKNKNEMENPYRKALHN
jgi:hypothetical protein